MKTKQRDKNGKIISVRKRSLGFEPRGNENARFTFAGKITYDQNFPAKTQLKTLKKFFGAILIASCRDGGDGKYDKICSLFQFLDL